MPQAVVIVILRKSAVLFLYKLWIYLSCHSLESLSAHLYIIYLFLISMFYEWELCYIKRRMGVVQQNPLHSYYVLVLQRKFVLWVAVASFRYLSNLKFLYLNKQYFWISVMHEGYSLLFHKILWITQQLFLQASAIQVGWNEASCSAKGSSGFIALYIYSLHLAVTWTLLSFSSYM